MFVLVMPITTFVPLVNHSFIRMITIPLYPMTDSEIIDFIRANPIEITNNSVSSGKHRVFAMIGRLVSNKTYLPLWSVLLKS